MPLPWPVIGKDPIATVAQAQGFGTGLHWRAPIEAAGTAPRSISTCFCGIQELATMASSTRYVTLVAVAAAVGGFLYGGDTSALNGAIPGIVPSLRLTSGEVGFVAAIGLLGCAAGAWFAAPLAARLGRTRAMGIAAACIAAGSLGGSVSGALAPLGLSRVLAGLGIGAASAVVPSYITEISPTRMRGRLGSMWQFAIVFGQLAGLLGSWALTAAAGGEEGPLVGVAAWRWMFGTVAVASLLYVLVTRGLPASPNDLMRQGGEAAARSLLERFDPEENVDARVTAISAGPARPTTPALRDLKGSSAGLKPIVWVGIALAVFQQLLGISVVKTYSNALWQAVGFGTNATFAISIATAGVSVVATVVAIGIVDRLPRRLMLGVGALVSALALGVLAWAFSQAVPGAAGETLDPVTGTVALVAMNLFALAFGITWGPVMWLMLGELFDGNLRVTAVAVATALNWMFNWVVTRTFPLLAAEGLGLAYAIYAVFGLLAALFVWKVLPETRDRALA
jgi:MFS transporter, SP family, sugar:H+ symporter